MTGLALNIVIGLQVLLGALTTALAAATSGKQASGAYDMEFSVMSLTWGIGLFSDVHCDILPGYVLDLLKAPNVIR